MNPTIKPGVNSCALEWQTVPASYNIPVVLLIYTIKYRKSLGSDSGNKTYTCT